MPANNPECVSTPERLKFKWDHEDILIPRMTTPFFLNSNHRAHAAAAGPNYIPTFRFTFFSSSPFVPYPYRQALIRVNRHGISNERKKKVFKIQIWAQPKLTIRIRAEIGAWSGTRSILHTKIVYTRLDAVDGEKKTSRLCSSQSWRSFESDYLFLPKSTHPIYVIAWLDYHCE